MSCAKNQKKKKKKPIVIVWVPQEADCNGDLCAAGLFGVVLEMTLLMERGKSDCVQWEVELQ